MNAFTLINPAGLVSSPAFSHVAVMPPGATTIFVGGQNAVDESGELVGGQDAAAQTRRVMANLVTALDAAGAELSDVVSMTVLLVAGVDLHESYAAAAETLSTLSTPPLVTAAVVSGLGMPGALVEVSAVAAVVR